MSRKLLNSCLHHHVMYPLTTCRLGEFQKVINSYSHIAMARRKLDGSLRGMILVKVEKPELDGKKFNLMTVSNKKLAVISC